MKSSGEVKLFVGILIVAVVLVAFAAVPTLMNRKPDGPPPPSEKDIDRTKLLPANVHVKGDPAAPYALVEFSDFQCPSCRMAATELEKVLPQYKGRLRLVFRHYQVATSHTNSAMMSQAAEAAAQQGKFWEMYDQLFKNQADLSKADPLNLPDALTKIATQIKLDALRFRAALNTDAVKAPRKRDMDCGDDLNIEATPTFYFVPPKGRVVVLSTTQEVLDWLKKPANWK